MTQSLETRTDTMNAEAMVYVYIGRENGKGFYQLVMDNSLISHTPLRGINGLEEAGTFVSALIAFRNRRALKKTNYEIVNGLKYDEDSQITTECEKLNIDQESYLLNNIAIKIIKHYGRISLEKHGRKKTN